MSSQAAALRPSFSHSKPIASSSPSAHQLIEYVQRRHRQLVAGAQHQPHAALALHPHRLVAVQLALRQACGVGQRRERKLQLLNFSCCRLRPGGCAAQCKVLPDCIRSLQACQPCPYLCGLLARLDPDLAGEPAPQQRLHALRMTGQPVARQQWGAASPWQVHAPGQQNRSRRGTPRGYPADWLADAGQTLHPPCTPPTPTPTCGKASTTHCPPSRWYTRLGAGWPPASTAAAYSTSPVITGTQAPLRGRWAVRGVWGGWG